MRITSRRISAYQEVFPLNNTNSTNFKNLNTNSYRLIAKSASIEIDSHSHSSTKPRISTTYYNNCTLARLTNELTLRLSSYCDCTIFHDTENREYLSVHRPYQDRADRIVHRVHVYEKTPIFAINEKHLPQALIY